MKCPVCEKQGLKSKVYPRGQTTTLLYYTPFYDEEGNYHHHDRNVVTQYYECSSNHAWMEKGHSSCPNPTCDFGSEPHEIVITQSKITENETKK
jgi:hypothetical protein